MDNIILYTTHCPKCQQLEKRLAQKNIQYTEIDNVEEMLDRGIKSAPYLCVDGELLDFAKAWKWVSQKE